MVVTALRKQASLFPFLRTAQHEVCGSWCSPRTFGPSLFVFFLVAMLRCSAGRLNRGMRPNPDIDYLGKSRSRNGRGKRRREDVDGIFPRRTSSRGGSS